jgi:pyridoxine 5-phosphate synthase
MTCKLSINLNKVALLRNARDLPYPSVTQAAKSVIAAGAQGITIHPRPDERHITRQDAHDLCALLQEYPMVEYNIEGNPFESDWLSLVKKQRPHQATLVPDDPNQSTSDHGWLPEDITRLQPIIAELKSLGIRVSIFMDAVPNDIRSMQASGADRVELYTEPYANAYSSGDDIKLAEVTAAFAESAKAAVESGFEINAGHDLSLENLPHFVQNIPTLQEVSIGHAFIADCLWFGLESTTQKYLTAISQA